MITSIGFIKLFKRPRTAATRTAVIESLTCTPSKTYAATNTATAVIKVFTMNLIMIFNLMKVKNIFS